MFELLEKLVSGVQGLKVGDSSSARTEIGSLVAKRQLDLVIDQVAEAVAKGAKVECGGRQPEGLSGAYYLPTVLTNISPEMRVWREEVFAPVLPVMTFKTETEAIKLANDTDYGLSAQVYSADVERALRVARQIEAGRIRINTAKWGSLECPFGGYKKSGMGREHGRWGFEELTQIKHVMIG
jgi:acyl-CoA reductase-like NAD-dependent aldehyde dehydrogenase